MTNINVASVPTPIIAAFDIGSNTIKMTVARRAADGRPDEFLWRSATVRLGAGIETTGRLADDRIAAAIEALRTFAGEAREAGATRLIGVATEATRVASNGLAFLTDVQRETGLELQTISGDREAELTFLGIAAVTDLSDDAVIADIGGGSTEVILARDGEFGGGQSLPLGSGRLADRLLHNNPPTRDQLSACFEQASRALDALTLTTRKTDRLLAVGGTGEYMVKFAGTAGPVTRSRVDELLDELTTVRVEALAERLTIPVARAQVLPAGIAIVAAVADRFGVSRIEGARSGIRAGLLMAAFAGEL